MTKSCDVKFCAHSEERAFSGCVRMAEPASMDWFLRENVQEPLEPLEPPNFLWQNRWKIHGKIHGFLALRHRRRGPRTSATRMWHAMWACALVDEYTWSRMCIMMILDIVGICWDLLSLIMV